MSLVHKRDRQRVLETVIVFLEMTSPPPHPPRPAPRRALAIRHLVTPTTDAYLHLYRAVGHAYHWTDRLQWPPQQLAATLQDPKVEIHLLQAGGAPAGFAELDFRRRPAAELALFGLLPAFLGQGLGGYFLDWALASLWRQGTAKVLVDTNGHDHPRALDLYRRAGFRELRRTRSWLVPSCRFPPLAAAGPSCHSAPPSSQHDEGRQGMKDDTRVTTAGRDPHGNHGIVNPPVYHASTVLFPTMAALEAAQGRDPRQVVYGRNGTPTVFSLLDAFCALEGGDMAVACGSGKAAIVTALMAFLKAGDHLLITDSAYRPARAFACGTLKRFGVEASFYDPTVGAGIAALMRPQTRVVYVESPGSVTFEVQDLPAIAAAAHEGGAVVVADNTWAGGYVCKPFQLGADIVLQAGTKYVVGHSDAMCGLVAAREPHAERLWKTFLSLGNCIGPDDAYLSQRGIRTLAVRMCRHHETGLKLARWLQARPEVKRVLHPGLEDDPGHALWRRDFTGASGLFGVLLHPVERARLAAMLDGMKLFGMGWSWGGYESLLVPVDPADERTAVPWREDGQLLRLHAGLEDAGDLVADLEAGFARLAGGR